MIFLFSFEKAVSGTDFILNDGIAADMLPQYEEIFKQLIDSAANLLELYKPYSKEKRIFSATVLDNNDLELKFSEGIAKNITQKHKDMIQETGTALANICGAVMNEATKKARNN